MYAIGVLILVVTAVSSLEPKDLESEFPGEAVSASSQTTGAYGGYDVNYTPHNATSGFCVCFMASHVFGLANRPIVQHT